MNKCKPKDGIFSRDVPNEVLDIIFSKLPQTSDLFAIALVCRHLRASVLPLLYKSLRLRAEWIADDEYYYIKQDELPIGLVSETIGRSLNCHPEMCKHVQNVSLRVSNKSWYENRGGHQRLLILLPSLKQLTLDPPPKEYDFEMNDRLTTMRLGFFYDKGSFWAPARRIDANSFNLNEYLSIPTLRKVKFSYVERRFYHNTIHTGTPASSAVTDLRFTDWHPEDVSLLASVLPSIRHLKHFMIDVRGRWMHHPVTVQMCGLVPHDYGLLLEPHTASLEELVIAYSNGAYNDLMHFPPKPSPVMGPLTNYHNLKRLAIPEPFLVGLPDLSFHSILPPNLQELQIQYPVRVLITSLQMPVSERAYYHVSKMETLANNKEEFVPRLKHVVWWFQRDPGPDYVNGLLPNGRSYSYRLNVMPRSHGPSQGPVHGPLSTGERLAKDFRKVGVKFQWVSEASFRATPFAKFLYAQ